MLENNSHFNLRERVQHVVSEHMRVEEFIRESQQPDSDPVRLGQLMDQSQESCQTLYQCSSPNLDAIVSIAKSNHALGARLTGAGWGGCAVLMVYKSQAQ